MSATIVEKAGDSQVGTDGSSLEQVVAAARTSLTREGMIETLAAANTLARTDMDSAREQFRLALQAAQHFLVEEQTADERFQVLMVRRSCLYALADPAWIAAADDEIEFAGRTYGRFDYQRVGPLIRDRAEDCRRRGDSINEERYRDLYRVMLRRDDWKLPTTGGA